MRSLLFTRFTQYFTEIARTGSVRKAAERLNVAPSALSRHLVRAEEEIGVPLFERLPRGLRLTAAGEMLMNGVRTWQRDESRLFLEIDELRGVRRGEVSIGFPEGVIGDFLPSAIAAFIREHPPITHRVFVAGSKEIWQRVRAGDIDIGLAFNPSRSPALRIVREVGFKLGAVVHPEHPFAGRSGLKLSDCATQPIIMPDEIMSLRDGIDRTASEARIDLHPLMQAASPGIIKAIVAHGIGIGLLTLIDVLDEVRSRKVAFVPLADRNLPTSYLSLIVPANRRMSTAAALVLRHLAETLDAIATETGASPETRPV